MLYLALKRHLNARLYCAPPLLVVLLTLAVSQPLSAQLVWTSLTYDDSAQTLNPYKGFMDYVPDPGDPPRTPEHSLEFFYIGMDEFYDDLNPQPVAMGGVDFGSLNAELESVRSRGRQAAFRIFIDFPEPLGSGQICPTYANPGGARNGSDELSQLRATRLSLHRSGTR